MFRSATVEDAVAIGRLKVRAWRAAYAGFMPQAYLDALDPAQDAADWAEYLTSMPRSHRLWVAVDDGTVTGFCRTGPADDDTGLGRGAAEVYGLYIEPHLIGTGLGRDLFAHAVTDLETRGHDPVCVYVYTPNAPALRFYERAGFSPDGVTRLDEEDGTGVPEVRLVKAAPDGTRSRRTVARYFEMWNTGDSAAASEILSSDWVDHAHPEVSGPEDVRRSVERIRAARPDLEFRIDAVLGDGDVIAVAGSVGQESQDGTRLMWLVRLEDGLMREMWTYNETGGG